MECARTRKLCDLWRRCNALVLAVVGTEFVQGWPDRYVCHTFFRGWIEFKEKGNLTKLQARILSDLRRRGAKACVLRFVENELVLEIEGAPLSSQLVPRTPREASELLRWMSKQLDN